MSRAGSPKSIDLGGREFKFTADADPTLKIGGVEVSYEPNGDGSACQISVVALWEISGGTIRIDMDNGDMEYLADFQESGGGDIVVNYAHDVSYHAEGNITDHPEFNPAKGTCSISCSGEDKAKKL